MTKPYFSVTPLKPAFIQEPTAGVVAGLAAIFSAFWNLHVVLLFALAVIWGAVDMAAGARRASLRQKHGLGESYDPAKFDEGLLGKAFYLVVSVLAGATLDSLHAAVGGGFDLGFADWFKSLTPFTSAALLWRFIKEWGSVLRNIDQTPGGADAIFPGLGKVVDALRWKMGHEGPLPERRWDDGLTPEKRAKIQMILEEPDSDTHSASSSEPS